MILFWVADVILSRLLGWTHCLVMEIVDSHVCRPVLFE